MNDQTPAPNEGQGSQDRKTPPIPDLKQSPSTSDQDEGQGQGSQDRKTPAPG
jgi:hypothetical protein